MTSEQFVKAKYPMAFIVRMDRGFRVYGVPDGFTSGYIRQSRWAWKDVADKMRAAAPASGKDGKQ